MNISTYKPLHRRTMLKGLGATIALPFLECMTPMARAAKAAMQPPKRLMFHWIGTATNMADWFPKDDGPNYTLPTALEPLARVRQHFSVISGTRPFPELDYGSGAEGGHNSALTWLTCQRKRTGPGPSDIITHSSVDQIAAKHLGADTRFPSLQLGIYKPGFHILSWSEYGTPLPTMTKPSEVFTHLFTERKPQEIAALKKNIARNKSILDIVQGSRQSLERKLGAADKEKLDQYLTSIRQLEQGFERDRQWADTPLPEINAGQPNPTADKSKKEWMPTMYKLIALAFEADLTRVVALAGDGPGEYNEFMKDVVELWHPISHHNRDPKKLAQMTKINRRNNEELANFIEVLEGKREKDGSSMLDHTLVLHGDSMTDGQHWGGNCPMILAGHAGGLKQGQHLKFCETPDYDPDKTSWPLAPVPTANLYLSMLQAANVPVNQFANATGFLPGLS